MPITLHVGKLHSRPDGYEIRLPDGEVVLGPRGEGLTLVQAEMAMDFIESRNKSVLPVKLERDSRIETQAACNGLRSSAELGCEAPAGRF